jgi:hypothetical protein
MFPLKSFSIIPEKGTVLSLNPLIRKAMASSSHQSDVPPLLDWSSFGMVMMMTMYNMLFFSLLNRDFSAGIWEETFLLSIMSFSRMTMDGTTWIDDN